MSPAEILDLLMLVALCALLLSGYPVAFVLGGTALLFAGIGLAIGAFGTGFLQALPQRIYGVMTNDVLVALPLFIYMGVVLERSKVAEDLLRTLERLLGGIRGGLGYAVTIVGALLAASTGVVGATAIAMGLIALPTMLRAGYDKRLACGSIAAAATLAQIVPPSTVLIVLADQIAVAYQHAQLASGVLAPDAVSVGDLFAGALFPGLMLAGLYLLYQVWAAAMVPGRAPALASDGGPSPAAGELLGRLLAPLVLIVAVLGSILGGLATPTEAASVGAVGATLLAARRVAPEHGALVTLTMAGFVALLVLAALFDLRIARIDVGLGDLIATAVALVLFVNVLLGIGLALLRLRAAGVLRPVLASSVQITSMIFMILIGATLFSLVFRGLGGDETVHRALSSLPGGPFAAILFVMAVMFLLGFFLDFLEIVFVVVPVVAPVLLRMEGIDPIWLAVMIAVNLQTSFLTPPFGPTLFYLRGVAPPEVATGDIYRGVAPFVAIQLLALVVLWMFPALATWLPHKLYR